MTIRDEMAKAICCPDRGANFCHQGNIGPCKFADRHHSSAADAALAFIKAQDPTSAMMAAGIEPLRTVNVDDTSLNGLCGRIFRAMLAKMGE